MLVIIYTDESTLNCEMTVKASELPPLGFVHADKFRCHYFGLLSLVIARKMSEWESKHYSNFRFVCNLVSSLTITRLSRQLESRPSTSKRERLKPPSPSGGRSETYLYSSHPAHAAATNLLSKTSVRSQNIRIRAAPNTFHNRKAATGKPTRISASPRSAPPSTAPLPAPQPRRHSSRPHCYSAQTTTPPARWPWR